MPLNSRRKPSFMSTSISTKMGAAKIAWNKLSSRAGLRPSWTPAEGGERWVVGYGAERMIRQWTPRTVAVELHCPPEDVQGNGDVPHSGKGHALGRAVLRQENVCSSNEASDHARCQEPQPSLAVREAEDDVEGSIQNQGEEGEVVSKDTPQGEVLGQFRRDLVHDRTWRQAREAMLQLAAGASPTG